jgi:methionine-rich copper-binding protein CopC
MTRMPVADGPVGRFGGLGRAVAAAAVAVLAGGALVLGSAGAASAHDFLVSTNPADGSTVTEPLTTVALTFNEPPLTQSGTAIAIEVHDPSGTNVASGSVSIVDSTLSIAVAPGAQGGYTVLWQTVSADGHPVSGQFGFDYEGPAASGAGSGAGSSTSSGQDAGDTASGPGQAAGSPTATAGAGPSGSGSGGVGSGPSGSGSGDAAASASTGVQVPYVLIGIGAAGGVIVIVAIVLVVGLRRRAR